MNDKDIDTKFDVIDEVIKVIHDKLAHRCETIERRLAALEAERDDLSHAMDTQVGIWRNVNDRVQTLEASINAIEDVLQDHGKMLVHLQTPKKADLETPVAAPQRTSDTVVFRQQPMYIKPLFEPGWSNDQKTSYEAGITDKREEWPDLTVTWYQLDPAATITIVQSWGDEAYFNLTAEKLRRLIGAAMEVLKRMEADNADAE